MFLLYLKVLFTIQGAPPGYAAIDNWQTLIKKNLKMSYTVLSLMVFDIFDILYKK